MQKNCLITVIIVLLVGVAFGQNEKTLKGHIFDDSGDIVENAVIRAVDYDVQTLSDEHGGFSIQLPIGKSVRIFVQHLSHKDTLLSVNTAQNLPKDFVIILQTIGEKLEAVNIIGSNESGYIQVNPKLTFQLPSPSGGMESLVKMLPGTSSNNELSSQYNVRGGNFDENLIFVNGIQIYRPFLVRNAQQEGMSFINSDLTGNVMFSAGGFDAKYGDKMSSVLDVQYKEPTQFGGSISGSLLGAAAHAEGLIDSSFSFLIGIRYKTNSYLLKSMETSGNYKPNFFDTQVLLNWKITKKTALSLLGNLSRNSYKFIPDSVSKNYGTIGNTENLTSFYEGQEVDRYQNYLAGITLTHKPDDISTYKVILSSYYAKEHETYDILAQYWLHEVQLLGDGSTELGDLLGYGSYLEHARNSLTSVVSAINFTGAHKLKSNKLEWGVKAQNEYIEDKIREWMMIDSSGYTLPQIPTTPGVIVDFEDPARDLIFGDNNFLNTDNSLNTWRFTGYVQDTWKIDGDSLNRFSLTGGLRFHYWTFNPKEFTVSPRLAFIYKPQWKQNWIFSLRTGLYYQPAFYREMRFADGTLNHDIKSQRSYQIVAGSEYNFKLWRRPFKFTAETYYKYLDRLITYNVNNVQIIYSGYNNAKGFATGLDMRISGEFVRGLESWFSVSLMKTMEDVIGDFSTDSDGNQTEIGYIPRPTDQRVSFNLFFQDHIPSFPQFRVHLNFVFASGLPYGPPKSEPAMRVFRTTWYRRIDLGLSFMFLEQSRDRMQHKSAFLRSIKNAGVYVEVFNLLGINNVSSYMWVTDIHNIQRSVPTYLTGRLINVKLAIEF